MSSLEHLKGKKILFFCVQAFNLEKDIVKQLEKHGALVSYFDERPANNNFTKGIIRIKRNFLKNQIKRYYKNIFNQICNEKFDYLLVNRGEVVPKYFLEKFIEVQPQCQRIFYTWDSFGNHSPGLEILDYFHKKFTFDRKDALRYNIGFRPLYFTDKYRKNYQSKTEKDIDLLFLGTAHSDRYIISNKIADWCKDNRLIAFNYYFMQGRFVYLYKKYFDPSFKLFDFKKLSFKSLTSDEIVSHYDRSNVVLDISHPGQSGLTMRTFETIGSGKKLITTNADIKDYPFYTKENIYILDRNNLQLDKSFFSNQYLPISNELYERCSIDGWLQDIFFGQESNFWKS